MRIGDLKPKGSDKTFDEWVDICDSSNRICGKCECRDECAELFAGYANDIEDFLELEV